MVRLAGLAKNSQAIDRLDIVLYFLLQFIHCLQMIITDQLVKQWQITLYRGLKSS